MSHLTTIKANITDIAAVQATCKELGIQFNLNATDCTSSFFTEKAAHTISGFTGTTWNVGLFQNKEGKGFTLGWDKYGINGRAISNTLGGEDAKKFLQLYAVNKATIEAKKKGYLVARQTGKNGNINLVVTGM